MDEGVMTEQSSAAVTETAIEEAEEGKTPVTCTDRVTTALRGWVLEEVIALAKLAVPMILTLIFQQSLLFVSILYVGHISGHSLELDSVALATSFVNVTGISVGIGLATAADTLCSQSYGFKNYKRVGHVFQRGVLILFLLSMFVWCVWLNTESLLLLFQQPPCVARLTNVYVQMYCLGLPPLFLYIMLQKYLQAQSLVWPFILSGAVTNVINAALHAIMIIGAGLGVPGAALSMVLSNYCQPLILIVYVWTRKLHTQTWGGWSWECLREWWQFLKLGLPGVAMLCVEWMSFEISAFVLGSIDEVQLGINSVMISILSLLAMPPVGLSISATVRVGNELGAGQPQRAKRAAYVAVLLAAFNATLTILFLQSTRSFLGRLYTNEQAILDRIPLMVHVVTPAILTDQIQFVIGGVIRGSGRQVLGACINGFSYYVFGLPIGISLALAAKMGTLGMWIGLNIASLIQCICFVTALLLTNWQHEANKAMEQSKDKVDEGVSKQETSSVSSSDTCEELIVRETVLLSQEEEELEEVEKEEVEEEEEAEDVLDVEELSLVVEKTQRKKRTLMFCQYPKTRVGLVLCRGSLFVLGAALVIGAGVSSQYHPPVSHGNYSECSDDNSSSDVLTATVPFPSLAPSSNMTVTVPSGSTVVLSPTRTVTSHSLQWSLGYSTTTVGSHSSASSMLYYITPTPS